jgi:hypothetical protein
MFRAVTDHIADNLAVDARNDWEWGARRFEVGKGEDPKDSLPRPGRGM